MNEKQVKEKARLAQLKDYTEQELTEELDRRRLTWALVMRENVYKNVSIATAAGVARNHGYHYFIFEDKVYAVSNGDWIDTKFTTADVK